MKVISSRFAALLGLLFAMRIAVAQTAPPPQPAAPPVAPNINILILALDDVAAPLNLPAPAPVPDNPVPAPVEEAAPRAAIAPAHFMTPFSSELGVSWRALAQKKKKDKDEELFRLEPERRGLFPKENTDKTQPEAPPTPATAPVVPLFAPPNPVAVPALGRAQIAAIPLRRSLLGLGYSDVLPGTLDGPAILRVVGERRLTAHVLENLRASFAQFAQSGATPAPVTPQPVPAPNTPIPGQEAAIKAAARVGMAVGYRAVIVFSVAPDTKNAKNKAATYSLLLVDAPHETGEAFIFDETGATEGALNEAAAQTSAILIDKSLRRWPEVTSSEKISGAQKHLQNAREALAKGDTLTAHDELNQAIALDGTKSEPYTLLGDLLKNSDPSAAAAAYRSAVQINARDGATWAKISIAYTTATIPDWPRALEAGRKALAADFDSVALRTAMATAQFGRADLFRRADRLDRAEDAEFDAQRHLDRALELAPDDPSAVRLLAKQLVAQNRYDEAVQTLDRIAPRYPKDLEIQTQYALALAGKAGREEDAFVTYGRVWKLTGQRKVDLDATTYRRLAEGFDVRLFNLGKIAVQLTTGVANAALPREAALLQLTRLKEDMEEAKDVIEIMRPPAIMGTEAQASRLFAADLMDQSLEAHQVYLETGQDLYRVRGLELYRQAVAQLNTARGGR